MCKQHDLYFDCGHKIRIRHSTCNFKITGLARDGSTRWAACMSDSYMYRDVPGLCSTCYLARGQEEIDFSAEALRLCMIGQYERSTGDDVDAWKAEQRAILAAAVPKSQAQRQTSYTPKATTWQTRKQTGRKSSLLRSEFKAEEVIGHDAWETKLVANGEPSLEIEPSEWLIIWDDSDSDPDADPADDSGVQLVDDDSATSENEQDQTANEFEDEGIDLVCSTFDEKFDDNELEVLQSEQATTRW